MQYNVFVENLNHLIRIIKKKEMDYRYIYFVKKNGNVYMTTTEGHIMPLYKMYKYFPTDYDFTKEEKEEETFLFSFLYDEVFESYLKAMKKNTLILFDSEKGTLSFSIGGKTMEIEKGNGCINILPILEMNINNVVLSKSFNLTDASSTVSYEMIENVLPTKKGTVSFFGDIEDKKGGMIATYSENKDYCAIVMPMIYPTDDIIKDDITEIKDFFCVG